MINTSCKSFNFCRDIYKLLDTVGLNDGESIHELKQHIHLLNEENKILISHLEQFKVFFLIILFEF